MDNNLSELSKPFAWTDSDAVDILNAGEWAPVFPEKYQDSFPLYSQEYVSALERREGRSAQRMTEMEADLADKNGIILEQSKRIAELERANQSQDDHINQQQDRIDSLEKTNAGLGRGLAAAEKQLAIPVRLPTEHELHQVSCSECAGNCLELVESTVRAAGFTFTVGDE
ncbi:hypothetical protein AB4M04_01515 [Serratia quinivorans]|uniref:Uncharacterized protein n=1 Tax=Serratia quinivorans TaxID=137545 RepID=A0ABV3UBA7_9GAMM